MRSIRVGTPSPRIEDAHQPVFTTLGILRVFCSALSPLLGLLDLEVEFLLEPPLPVEPLEVELWEEGLVVVEDEGFFADDAGDEPFPLPLEPPTVNSVPLP